MISTIPLPEVSLSTISLSLPLPATAQARVRKFEVIGEPPEGALQDIDGYFIVDKYGNYIVPND